MSLPCKAPGDFWFPPVQLGPDAVPGGQRCSPECGTCVASSWPASVAKKKFSGWLGATRPAGMEVVSWMETLSSLGRN